MFFKTDSKAAPEKSAFGLFKDLNKPFKWSLYSQFAPIRGINQETLKNVRLYGHYGPEMKGFSRPIWNGMDTKNFPQDWTASLLEFFAPSYIGFLFDSIPSTPFHSWFKPANIALIFNTISEESFYNNARDSVLKLARCLQPNANFIQLEKEEKKRLAFKEEGPLYGAFSKLQCLSWPTKERPFAEILFEALNETKGDGATKLGYPNHIVELILLTYMWHRKKSKLDLKPFYDNLSDRIIDKSEVDEITWQNAGSFYRKNDYLMIAARHKENQTLSKEHQLLMQLGYPYFEDQFPPKIGYGVSVLKSGSFSDCGEIELLFNYFSTALYNFETKQFDCWKFKRLENKGFNVRKQLISFFQDTHTSPIFEFTQHTRNAWSEMLSDLNADSLDSPIAYLKDTCCIAPGFDNIIKVMKKLLQPPVDYSKDIFLELLNVGNHSWIREDYVDDDESLLLTFSRLPPDNYKILREKYLNKTLTFADTHSKPDKIFSLHFQKNHFAFNRLKEDKGLPHKDPAASESKLPSLLAINNETAFAEHLFQGNLESIEGKCHALYKIFWFKNKFDKHSFDYLIHRWIEPTGKYFAGWEDYHTNRMLLHILLTNCNLPLDTIYDMKIPELVAQMVMLAQREGKPMLHIIVKYMELFNIQERPFINNHSPKVRNLISNIIRGKEYQLEKFKCVPVDALSSNPQNYIKSQFSYEKFYMNYLLGYPTDEIEDEHYVKPLAC